MGQKDNNNEGSDLFGIKKNKMKAQQNNTKPNDMIANTIRLEDIINLIKTRFQLILLLTIFSALVSIVISLLTPPVYKADVVMINQSNDQTQGSLASIGRQFGSIAQLAGVEMPGDLEKGTALAIMRSRQFTDRFLEEFQLLPYFYENQWDQKNNQWIEGLPPRKSDIYLKMEGIINVAEDRATGILTLSVLDSDPNMSAKIANNLVYFLNQNIREDAIKESEIKIEYLNRELEKTTMTDARQMLFGLIAQQTQKIMLANAKEDYVFKIIDPAIPPEFRIKPKRKTMVITGTLIGGFLSFLFAVFYENRRTLIKKLKEF
tara:strand:- start:2767 stop:3723 length:957 start_codon:yes stop_codon:yes gene_type:complete